MIDGFSMYSQRGDNLEEPLDGNEPAVQVSQFPGGEPHVIVTRPELIHQQPITLLVRGGSFQTLGAALVVNNALRQLDASQVRLLLPYLPGARMDRGAPLTAKVYADLINAARFDEVVCLDPHSDVMPALLDRLTIHTMPEIFPTDLLLSDQPTYLICPDLGAAKRVDALAAHLRRQHPDAVAGVLQGRKHRDFTSGKLTGFSCDPLPQGAFGFIVDDICDGGGTFIGLAEVIGADPEHLGLWVSHGIFSAGVPRLTERFSLLGCTDSWKPADQWPAEVIVAPVVSHLLGLLPSG